MLRAPTFVVCLCLALLLPACGSESGVSGDGGVPDGAAALGEIGAACAEAQDCAGRTCLTWLEGGYCSVVGCDLDNPCPPGSACVPVRSDGDEQNVCLKLCDMLADCRTEDDYACDRDATCWPAPEAQERRPVGAPCQLDGQCADNLCMLEYFDDLPTGNTGGFCTRWNCLSNGCPAGTRCIGVTGGSVCLPACASDEDCREGYLCDIQNAACLPGCETDATCPDKHVCVGNWCVESIEACSVTNPAGWCPSGQRCEMGVCTTKTFSCEEDSVLEPNDTMADAAPLEWGRTAGLRICESDEDWYEVQAPAGLLTEVTLLFNDHAGNLDLLAYSDDGGFLRSLWRDYPYVGDLISDFDVSGETITFYPGLTDRTHFVRVLGSQGERNTYGLAVRRYPYEDGPACEGFFDEEECRGLPGGVIKLYQFPVPDPDDPYGGELYDFATVGSYFWARREAIQIVRDAIRATAEQFPATGTLYLVDTCQEDGLTPGHDIGALRHCRTCHDQGGNVDITYYQTGADNWTRTVCGPGGSNVSDDGAQCTPAAVGGHIVDLDPQVFFMAKLLESPRTRVIGVDPVLAGVLRARAATLVSSGAISRDGYEGLRGRLASWPTHHDHIHLSLQWW